MRRHRSPAAYRSGAIRLHRQKRKEKEGVGGGGREKEANTRVDRYVRMDTYMRVDTYMKRVTTHTKEFLSKIDQDTAARESSETTQTASRGSLPPCKSA